jgi:hypothetical protein
LFDDLCVNSLRNLSRYVVQNEQTPLALTLYAF